MCGFGIDVGGFSGGAGGSCYDYEGYEDLDYKVHYNAVMML